MIIVETNVRNPTTDKKKIAAVAIAETTVAVIGTASC